MTLDPTAATQTMIEAIADLMVRIAACQSVYNAYDPACSRRATHDNLVEVVRSLGSVNHWLAGKNDQPVAWMSRASTQEGRDTYRIHYAADSLVAAEHYILVAEYAAGLRDQATVESLDPWRYIDHVQQGEIERLRLAEGTIWLFNEPI